MDEYVRHTLQEGLEGWQVTDCKVTLTQCGYASPSSTAADFRKLTPLVLMNASSGRARRSVSRSSNSGSSCRHEP